MSLKDIKISVPEYADIVPSLKKPVKLTPFRVGDEKTLLIASGSNDTLEMANAMKQVIGNCVKGAKVEDMTSYDLEYLFLKLRAKSVGEISTVGLACEECSEYNQIDIELSTIEVVFNERHSETIKIEDTLAFKMRYPEPEDIVGLNLEDPNSVLEAMLRCIKEVYTQEEQITITPSDYDDLRALVSSMTSVQFEKIKAFFDTMPKVSKKVEFTCGSCGHENKTVLEGIANFF